MKKKLGKSLKWLLLGVVCGILAVIGFKWEMEHGIRKHRFSIGCGIMAVVFLVGSVVIFFDKQAGKINTLIIEDIFKINPKGCVVMGTVQGTMVVGEKVMIQDQSGNRIKTTINGMEIYRQQVKVAVDTPVALFFKNIEPHRIHKGDKVSYEQ